MHTHTHTHTHAVLLSGKFSLHELGAAQEYLEEEEEGAEEEEEEKEEEVIFSNMWGHLTNRCVM